MAGLLVISNKRLARHFPLVHLCDEQKGTQRKIISAATK